MHRVKIIVPFFFLLCLKASAASCSWEGTQAKVEVETLYGTSSVWGSACIGNDGVIEFRSKNGSETFRAIPHLPPPGEIPDEMIDRFDLVDQEGMPTGSALGKASPFGGKEYELDIYRLNELTPQRYRFQTE